MRILVALVLVLASITHGMCATPPDLRVAGIQAQQRALRETLADRSGPDNPMSKARREKIMAQQDRLFGLIEGKATTADLSPEDRAEVFALMASITDDINAPGEERVICRSETRVGSNYMTRVCRTARKMREDEEVGHGRLEEAKRSVCNDKNGCY